MFAAVCVALSAAGHGLAAGTSVSGLSLSAGFLGVLAVAVPLAGRERALGPIAAALAAGQFALHTLFRLGAHTMGSGATASAGEDPVVRFASSLVCGEGAAGLSPAEAHLIVSRAGIDPAAVGGHVHPASGASTPSGLLTTLTGTAPGLPMLLGHLLAALATGWLLRRGEIALFRVVRLSLRGGRELAAAARLRALRLALVLVRALRTGLGDARAEAGRELFRRAEDTPAPSGGDPLQHQVIRRGPPAAYTLAA